MGPAVRAPVVARGALGGCLDRRIWLRVAPMKPFVTGITVLVCLALHTVAGAEMTADEVHSAFREFFLEQRACADEMEHSVAGIEAELPACTLGAAAACRRMDALLASYDQESVRCSTEGERMTQRMERAPTLEESMPADIQAAQVELKARWAELIPRYLAATRRVKEIER